MLGLILLLLRLGLVGSGLLLLDKWLCLFDHRCFVERVSVGELSDIVEVDFESEIHWVRARFLYCRVAWLIRFFFCGDINILISSLCRGLFTLTTFEVENVGFDCTEWIIVAYVEAIRVLSGLWGFLYDADSLHWLLLGCFSGTLVWLVLTRWFRWSFNDHLPSHWLSLIEVKLGSFAFLFAHHSHRTELLRYWLSFIERAGVRSFTFLALLLLH
jgi:hypothetical protein